VPEHGGCGFLAATSKAVADMLVSRGTGAEQALYGAMHHLPCDYSGKKQRWYCGGAASLKNGVAPLAPDDITKYLATLKNDLNSSFGFNLDTNTGPQAAMATNEDAYSKWRFVIVGASHATRMADVMAGLNMVATSLGTASWFPSKKNCEKLAADLQEFLDGLEPDPDRKTVVIFSHLDKSYFQARAEDGNLIPHRLHEGAYHIDGDLVAIPSEQLKYLFELLLAVFNTAAGCTRLLLCPIPRYLWRGCCEDDEHGPNRADEGFQENMLEGLEKAKRTMRSRGGRFWNFNMLHKNLNC
jgi:hypothetical protein